MTVSGRRLVGYAGAAAGVVLPAASFFTSYPPPLFLGISILTSALSAAIFAIVATGVTGGKALPDRAPGRRAGIYIVAAFVFLAVYILLFQFTTLPIPRPEKDKDKKEERVQIGFNSLPWSLTTAGKGWTETNPAITAYEIASNEAAFAQERVPIAWKIWTIYTAGSVLIMLYSIGFLLWTAGFALLGITDNGVPVARLRPVDKPRRAGK